MKTLIYLLCIVVGALNVCMHFFVKKSADSKIPFYKINMDSNFSFAILCGLISVFCIMTIYNSKEVSITQGILVMGASSILIGSLLGLIVQGNKLEHIDILVLVALCIYYTSKITNNFSF